MALKSLTNIGEVGVAALLRWENVGDPDLDSYGPRYWDLVEGELLGLPSSEVLELLFLALTGK